ncbi:hypothetical protein [Sphingomonas phyllosphaerae]|uniref:hypothetical protein n=1 Tax=Sphingomonas phyllosphaerae TaxID=257003 RepID=UPI0003B5F467|nr:hypothetical protein [Sphingomonas phyllosphaerae]
MSRDDQAKSARTLAERASMIGGMAAMLAKSLHIDVAGSSAASACEGLGYLADQVSLDLHDLSDAIERKPA